MTADKTMGGEAASLFGDRFDAMARRAGGWPKGAVAYAVEIVGGGANPMVLITGEVPVGVKRDGSPRFGRKQARYKAGVKLSQYRAALPPLPNKDKSHEG